VGLVCGAVRIHWKNHKIGCAVPRRHRCAGIKCKFCRKLTGRRCAVAEIDAPIPMDIGRSSRRKAARRRATGKSKEKRTAKSLLASLDLCDLSLAVHLTPSELSAGVATSGF